MGDWKEEIVQAGRDAFCNLDLNTGKFEEVIAEARKANPYHGDLANLWNKGFDEERDVRLPGLRVYDRDITYAAKQLIADALNQCAAVKKCVQQ